MCKATGNEGRGRLHCHKFGKGLIAAHVCDKHNMTSLDTPDHADPMAFACIYNAPLNVLLDFGWHFSDALHTAY